MTKKSIDLEVILFLFSFRSRAGCPANLPLRSIPPTPYGAGPSRSRGHGFARAPYPTHFIIKKIAILLNFKGIAIAHLQKNDYLVVELLYLYKWDSMEQFKAALREYVDYYNNKRITLRLNGLSPVQYRTQHM